MIYTFKALLGGIVVLAVVQFGSDPARADGPLVGNWRGTGTVTFPSGETERATCRATIKSHDETGIVASTHCNLQSGSFDQDLELAPTVPNRYAGGYHNDQYNISGTVRVQIKGESLDIRADGNGGHMVLTMNR